MAESYSRQTWSFEQHCSLDSSYVWHFYWLIFPSLDDSHWDVMVSWTWSFYWWQALNNIFITTDFIGYLSLIIILLVVEIYSTCLGVHVTTLCWTLLMAACMKYCYVCNADKCDFPNVHMSIVDLWLDCKDAWIGNNRRLLQLPQHLNHVAIYA